MDHIIRKSFLVIIVMLTSSSIQGLLLKSKDELIMENYDCEMSLNYFRGLEVRQTVVDLS